MNAVGNGISILDSSGVNPLTVSTSNVATALVIDGTEPGTDNTVPLIEKDVNQHQANGALNLLVQLQNALIAEDLRTLERIDPLFDAEIERFTGVRGEIGGRLRVLDDVENHLLDEEIKIQESLSVEFDADLTKVITQLTAVQATLEGTLRIAANEPTLDFL